MLEKTKLKPYFKDISPYLDNESGIYRKVICQDRLDANDRCLKLTAQGKFELISIKYNKTQTARPFIATPIFSGSQPGAFDIEFGYSIIVVMSGDGFGVYDHQGRDIGFYKTYRKVVGVVNDVMFNEGVLLHDLADSRYYFLEVSRKTPNWKIVLLPVQQKVRRGKVLFKSSKGVEFVDVVV